MPHTPLRLPRTLALLALVLVVACTPAARTGAPAANAAGAGAEILWDRYGVPHIYASDHVSLFRAFGWAQARNHADLLLRQYGKARGRGAEY